MDVATEGKCSGSRKLNFSRSEGNLFPDRPVVIIGKGPNATGTTSDCPHPVCALNGAINICGRVDYWFANDYTAFGEFHPVKLLNVRRAIILPEYLHLDTSGKRLIYWRDAIRGLTTGRYSVYTYNLHTSRSKNSLVPDFGTIMTVGETAVCWMLREGYRNFLLSGVGKRRGYSNQFAGGAQTGKSAGHFARAFSRIKDRVAKFCGSIDTWKGSGSDHS